MLTTNYFSINYSTLFSYISVAHWSVLDAYGNTVKSNPGNTGRGLGQEAELQYSCCKRQEAKDELEPMSALIQVLGTLRCHGPQLSGQDEESREEKKNLRG